MDNLGIYNMAKDVPENAKRPINGGRLKGKTDINPMWRIKKLTELFGPCGIGWYYKTVKKWVEEYQGEVAAFVDIDLFVKTGGEWSMPISGTGGSMLGAKEKNGFFLSDECYKMATTDAISVACKQLGIGADVYWNADTTKYTPPSAVAQTILGDQIKRLESEMIRTGITLETILNIAKTDRIDKIRISQYESIMKKFARTPDKIPDPAPPDAVINDLPDNGDLPFT